jgi:hypothetical protein
VFLVIYFILDFALVDEAKGRKNMMTLTGNEI